MNIFKKTAALSNKSPSCCYPSDLPNTCAPADFDSLLNLVTVFPPRVRRDLNEGNSLYKLHGEVHSPLHLNNYMLNGGSVSHLPALFCSPDNSPFNIQMEFADTLSFLVMLLCMQQDGGPCRLHAAPLFSGFGLLTKPQTPSAQR